MDALFEAMANNMFWSCVFLLFVLWSVSSTITTIFKTRAREHTRREIAAYVAEGSMTPEQGERLLAAAPPDEDD